MNNVYRVIWNKSTQTFQAVCEFAKAQGKSSAKMVGSNNLPKSATKAFALTALAAGMILSSSAWAQDEPLKNTAKGSDSLALDTGDEDKVGVSDGGSGGIAIGKSALAAPQQGSNSKPAQNVAIGVNSETVYGGVAIGYKASTFAKPKNSPSTNFEHGDPGDHAQSVAIGYEATASGDQSVALGAQARAEGSSSIAIGGDDLDKAASTSPPQYNKAGNNDTSNDTKIARKYKDITNDYLVDFSKPEKRYTATKAGEAAVAIGVQSQAGDLATAFGTRTKASGDTSVALGVGASATEEGSFAAAAGAKSEGKSSIAIGTASQATKEGAVAVGKNAQSTDESSIAIGTAANAMHKNSVALGAGSVTAVATAQKRGTVNGVTYGDFSGVGSAKNGSVSVGDTKKERQIKHVAAGEVSDSSTDAINGSQLYMVAKGTLEQMPVVYTNKNGDKLTKAPDGKFYKQKDIADATWVDGKFYKKTDIINGNPTAGATAINPTANNNVIASMQNADGTTNNPTALANVAGNLKPTYNVGDNVVGIDGVLKPKVTRLTATTEQAAPTNVAGIYNNAATVGDVLNVGWNLQGNGTAKDFVKAYDTVNFVNGTGTTAKVTSNAKGTSSDVTFDVNTDGTTITTNLSGQITANTTGLTNGTDGKVKTSSDADKGKLVTAGDIANAINNAGFTLTTSASAGEVQGNTNKLVNPGATVTIDAGKNVKVTQAAGKITLATKDNVEFTSVKTGNTTLNNNGLTITNGPSVTNTGINAGNKRITNVIAGTDDTDAVNLKQLKDSRTTVQSSDNSISVTQTEKGGHFDYDIKVNNQGVVNNAQLPVVYTNKNGDKVYLITKPDGAKSFNTKADGTGDTVNNSDVIASMQNADGSTTEPTTLANVAGNLEPTYNVGDNVVGIDGVLKPKVTRLTATTEQAAPTNVAGIYNNAATVGDVLNVGWNLQGNGTAKDFVKAYDTVNFVNGTGTTAKVTSNAKGTSSDVTFDVNTDGTTITTKEIADPNNPGKTITQVTANTTKLGDANKDGKVDTPSDDNKGKLVTAGDIANAINNAGFTLTVQGENGSLVKPGATVNMKNTDKNIVIDKSANSNDVVYNLAKDITVDSVKAGNTTLNNDGLTIAGGPSVTNTGINAGNKKITNVTAGTNDTDAVNLKQLKDSRTTVRSSDNSISVTQTEKGGHFDYDIKVNNQGVVNNAQLPVVYTDKNGNKVYKQPDGSFNTAVDGKGVTVNKGNVIASMQNADGSTTAPTTLTNVKSNLPSTYNNDVYNTGNKPVTTGQTLPEKINTSNAATAGDVLNSGWNLQGNGTAKDFVKAYDTVNFVNGTGTTAKVTSNAKGTSSDVTFDVNTDGTTITTNSSGQITANTTGLTNGTDGKVKISSDADKGKLVNAGDIANAINNAGFTLTVQGENGSLVKPGATVNMKNTDKNIVIDKSANSNDVVYNLAKDITVDSVKAGNTTLNNKGVTINNGPSFTKDKVDVAGNKITGVADGDISATSKDAINGSQLHAVAEKVGNLNARVDGVADDANAGVSSAMAMAALPQAYLPGKSMLTGGMASYNGEGAVAVGFSKLSDNGRWVLKMSGSADTQGNAGVAVGAGFHF